MGRMKRVIDLLQGELTLGLVNGGGYAGWKGVNLGAVEMTRSRLQEREASAVRRQDSWASSIKCKGQSPDDRETWGGSG